MVNITYSRQVADDFAITTARSFLPLYGRWTDFTLSTYCNQDHMVAMTFGMRPIEKNETRPSLFEATRDGMFRQELGQNGHRRTVIQEIAIRPCAGAVLEWTEVDPDEPVYFGREFSRVLLRKMESIIETTRLRIRRELSTSCRSETLVALDKRFGKMTETALTEVLGQINWALMLSHANIPDQALTVIDTSTRMQRWQFYSIPFDGQTNIPPLPETEASLAMRSFADHKAAGLLRHVCGEALSQEFQKLGRITVKERGYTFILAPYKFVECIDPDNKKAQLCIHTVSFTTNPIDELTIGYLNIRNRFREYMNMAIVHGADPGFSVHKNGQ